MELGIIGLGRMGANMAERLNHGGHRVVGYDRDPSAVSRVVGLGTGGADSLSSLVEKLAVPRAIWMMLPSGAPVDETIAALIPHLASGDLLIDGGNSNYKDSKRRAAELKSAGFQFVDVGTSGGIWGLKEGYSMMVGGDATAVERM
jgi:6-phosphogluconate dehydrogenase